MKLKISSLKQDLIHLVTEKIKTQLNIMFISPQQLTIIQNFIVKNNMNQKNLEILIELIKKKKQEKTIITEEPKPIKIQEKIKPKLRVQTAKPVHLQQSQTTKNQTKDTDSINSEITLYSFYKSKNQKEWGEIYEYQSRKEAINQQFKYMRKQDQIQQIKQNLGQQVKQKQNKQIKLQLQEQDYINSWRQQMQLYDEQLTEQIQQQQDKKQQIQKSQLLNMKKVKKIDVFNRAEEKKIDQQIVKTIQHEQKETQLANQKKKKEKLQLVQSLMRQSLIDHERKLQYLEQYEQQEIEQYVKYQNAQDKRQKSEVEEDRKKQETIKQFISEQSNQGKIERERLKQYEMRLYNEQCFENERIISETDIQMAKNKESIKQDILYTLRSQIDNKNNKKEREIQEDREQGYFIKLGQILSHRYQLYQEQEKQQEDLNKIILKKHQQDVLNQVEQKQKEQLRDRYTMRHEEMLWNKNFLKQSMKDDPVFASQMVRCIGKKYR